MRAKTNQKRATKGSCGDEARLGRVFGENHGTEKRSPEENEDTSGSEGGREKDAKSYQGANNN